MQSLSNSNPDKISCYVGFAIKSGKVIWGLDMLKKSKKQVYNLLFRAKNSFQKYYGEIR